MAGHPVGHQTASLAELPPHCSSVASQVAKCMHNTATVGQSTCGCPGLSKCVQTLSLVGHQTLSVSQCVSLIKIGCMQRATPQPSEAEMGFDFHNPVSSVQLDPSTYMLTEQECSVKANRSILCHSANKH